MEQNSLDWLHHLVFVILILNIHFWLFEKKKKKLLLLLFRLPEELPKMALETALKECFTALSFFLNNRFADALALLKPW